MHRFLLTLIYIFQVSSVFGQEPNMLYQKNMTLPTTEREELLVRHASESLKKSQRLESNLSTNKFKQVLASATWRDQQIIPIHNMPLKNISDRAEYHLLNNLCSLPDAMHLHIGLLAGDSFIAALYGNQAVLSQQIGIDYFQECPESMFYTNCNCFLDPIRYQIVNSPCFNINKSIFKSPIDIYFYDADHSIKAHERAFTFYNDFFADTFIAVVDDWNCPWIRCATFKAFDKLDYAILYEDVLLSYSDQRERCQYLAVLKKSSCKLVELESPSRTVFDRNTVFNQNKSQVFKTIEGSWCSKEKASLIMDTIFYASPEVCVEIGVFTGSSFLPIVTALSCCGQGHAYAVDAWSNVEAVKGIPDSEHYTWWSSVDMKSVYNTFCRTLSNPELSSYFTIISLPSDIAYSSFEGIDFLHLDGSFSGNQSRKDFELYFPKVNSGGYILLSNAFFSIDHHFFKVETLCDLIDRCEVISEVDNNSTILFQKP